jgi:hypothetical protein
LLKIRQKNTFEVENVLKGHQSKAKNMGFDDIVFKINDFLLYETKIDELESIILDVNKFMK